MEKQISIIIRTYNMESYIGKCLDSLLIPELDAVEVLVVNDGSKDRSSEIAHLYAKRYPDSIRVIDKENGNYCSCINAALPLATGRYVKVLDADDTFDTYAFSEFVRSLPECEEDVIITGFMHVYSDGEVRKVENMQVSSIEFSQPYEFKEIEDKFFNTYTPMHQISYRRNFINKLNYHQTEGVSYSDAEWSIIPLSYCHSVKFMNIFIYRYLIGREGQTVSPEAFAKSVGSILTVLGNLASYHQLNKECVPNADFLFHQVLIQHEYNYNKIVASRAIENNALKEYDCSLPKINRGIYERLGCTLYDSRVKFKHFTALREKDYPSKLTIPLWVRIMLGIKSRL